MLQRSTMRRTSVRELHIHTSKLVREASDGGNIVIERRGRRKESANLHLHEENLGSHAASQRQYEDPRRGTGVAS